MLFKCGHPKTPENSRSNGINKPVRCAICKRKANSKWEKENLDRYQEYNKIQRDKNPEKARERKRKFLEANPTKMAEYTANYRALKRAATVGHVDFIAILERDKSICHMCLEVVEPEDLHFDHVIPVSKGGEHSMDNIKVCHKICNLQKAAKVISSGSFASP